MLKLTNKVGVFVDAFGMSLREGLKKAREIGVDGVQIHGAGGEMDPALLGPAQRRQLRDYIDSLGLEVSALCCDMGGHGFMVKRDNIERIEKSKRILDLAVDIGTNIVTTHIGVVPNDPNSEMYEIMQSACFELSEYAAGMNAFFAIETGPETAAHLKSFLDSLGSKGAAVNFDPANMVTVTGDDPVRGVHDLKKYIVHTHVKDGIRYREVDPREVFGDPSYVPPENKKNAQLASEGSDYAEVPLGEGRVDFEAYFAALKDVGYQGYLTIEQEVGDRIEEDIRNAVKFINRYKL